ncbi:IS30 family transposase [Desulfosporosinus sp. SYSU MS00001]|uniref:IS30 family transposase n=1 Tax=Desulfosporosinus sp. SYSU MS00001 TaxID=3416284 RepID=UPI003CEAADDE
MPKFKHFTLDERVSIEVMLKSSLSFKAIARELGRDCTTISKEIKNHIMFKRTGAYGRPFNNCIHRMTCNHAYLCDKPNCRLHSCRFCSDCSEFCSEYKPYICHLLSKPPYVCNGCAGLTKCTLEKSIYKASYAHEEYVLLRSESRSGITISEDEIQRLDKTITPLIQRGQSIHHICINNRDLIMHSEKSIYNYIDYNLISAKNIDLPRKVTYRHRKKRASRFKVDKSYRIGRTYKDFLEFMGENPDTPVVEMDSVEGIKGGKVLLTIHFIDSQFMLAFIRDANTSRSVIDIFENLYWELGPETFLKLFPVILTDNGSEFTNPKALEFDRQGNRITHIFYCDPSAPYQKGAAENNHELIRRIVPKGQSFNSYEQKDISLMMSHINSYSRKKLNDRSPHSVFSFLYGAKTLVKLDSRLIQPNEIIMNPNLLK